MSSSRAVMLSLWRDDVERNLAARALHLLKKSYTPMRWVWVVGDSSDDTEAVLRAIARYRADKDITVIRHDTGIVGEDPNTRLARLSATADAALDTIAAGDGMLVMHESDLRTPVDIVQRFVATGKSAVAGWPTLTVRGITMFYDIWAYRVNGEKLTNDTPPPAEMFEVDSFGSCWMASAEDIRGGARCHGRGVLGICSDLREKGRTLWVDPSIPVVQPESLWKAQNHPHEAVVA